MRLDSALSAFGEVRVRLCITKVRDRDGFAPRSQRVRTSALHAAQSAAYNTPRSNTRRGCDARCRDSMIEGRPLMSVWVGFERLAAITFPALGRGVARVAQRGSGGDDRT